MKTATDPHPTDPRRTAPACTWKGCRAGDGDQWCYTATGFRRHWHAVRVRAAAGLPPAAEKAEDSLTGKRPTEAQHRILTAALANNGRYELSGYNHHGDASRRAAMAPMSDPARRWFSRGDETPHGTLYEITEAGRAAWQRYEDWMNGAKR